MAYTPIANGETGLSSRNKINGIGTGLDTHAGLSGSEVHSLKSMVLQSASAVNITGGTLTGVSASGTLSGSFVGNISANAGTLTGISASGTFSGSFVGHATLLSGSIVTQNLKTGTATDNTAFEPTGFMVLTGSATYWDDLRVPMTSSNTGGARAPGFSIFRNNGASQGVYAYQFDKQIEEELFFEVQMPHGYKFGSPLYPHAHWSVITVPAGGTTVRWGLEYSFADINGIFTLPNIIYTTATDPATQYKHHLNAFSPEISGSSISIVSAMILCRVFRDVTNDNFDDDAALLEIDFHYQADTLGSRQPVAK